MNFKKNVLHPSQRVQLPKRMTVKGAVEYMKTAVDIVDWNLKRKRVIRRVGWEKFNNHHQPSDNSYVTVIDHKGLCGKTLKRNKNHKPFHELM